MPPRETAQPISGSVLADRYLAPGEGDCRDVFRRVSLALALVEAEPLRSRVASRFYRNMLRGAIGAGRVMANAGTLHRATMVNCFVQPLCPPGSRTASARDIEQALADACATLSMGGGVGYDFSPVPPVFAERGDVDRATNGDSKNAHRADRTGVCSVIDRFDDACRRLTFEGARRGAQMAVLRCDHPDLVAFVRAKRGRTRWHTFNVSVAVTDAFMRAVASDAPWTLSHRAKPAHLANGPSRRPDGTFAYAQVGARALWREIVECARDSAEPEPSSGLAG